MPLAYAARPEIRMNLLGRAFAFLSFLMSIAGCQPHRLPPPDQRQRSEPAQVKIYTKAPKEYEMLGLVESAENLKWSEGSDVTPLVDDLRTRAAELGANGLLLAVDPDEVPNLVRILGRYEKAFYEIPFQTKPTKRAVAKAIYVMPK
jgi:hypothetical protein